LTLSSPNELGQMLNLEHPTILQILIETVIDNLCSATKRNVITEV